MAEPRLIPIPKVEVPEGLRRGSKKTGGDAYPCVVCQVPCNKPKYMVHLVAGGGMLCHPDDEYADEKSDLYWYPVGACCLKKFPHLKEYAVKQESP